MSKKESKKNIEKLKVFLAKQTNDTKTSTQAIRGNSTSSQTN